MSKQKRRLMNLRVTDEFAARLNRAAEVIDRPVSQIVREAVNEKLEQLARKHPELQQQAA
jgi:predicted DNA-binding protein